MQEGITALLILLAYFGVMKWILPKLGVPT